VEEGFHLAVRLGKLLDSSTLAARPLGHYDYVVCASPQYLRRYGKPKTVSEFDQHTGIIYVRPGPEIPWLVAGSDGELQELRVRRKLRMDDFQAIVDAALAGAGLARLPRWFAEPHVRSGALRQVWVGAHAQSVEVHAVWPQTRFMPMKTRAAIDMLASEVPKQLLAQ
jgi:DNA-binding transcriptional LysR family regulator